ncbi:hypothetical protein ACHM05_00115 [Staphylococcus aureus]|uniref:hypothetical protein n=1 Tax=Staphylococcus aureus TaxID=1280 RepID=UPI0037738FCA
MNKAMIREAVYGHVERTGGEKLDKLLNELLAEIECIYRKAEGFDHLEKIVTNRLKEIDENNHGNLENDYEYGIRQTYEIIDDELESYKNDADI